MPVWFAGTMFGTAQSFQLVKDDSKPPLYTANVGALVYPVTEDFERQILEPNRATQCYRIDKGLFLFPWNWGRDNSTWPRFETKMGDVHLIQLEVERGQLVPANNGYPVMMASIKNLLAKDRKRFDRERLRARK